MTVVEPAPGQTAYATFTVTLPAPAPRRMRVLAQTRNGTARHGDEDVEADETGRVEVTVADGSATLDPSFATVTIVDDDSGGGVPPFDPQ